MKRPPSGVTAGDGYPRRSFFGAAIRSHAQIALCAFQALQRRPRQVRAWLALESLLMEVRWRARHEGIVDVLASTEGALGDVRARLDVARELPTFAHRRRGGGGGVESCRWWSEGSCATCQAWRTEVIQ